MRTRTTVILLLLAVAIGAYIKLYESKRPNTEEAARQAQNVLTFARDKINGIIIQNGDERTELKRIDKKWRLMSPVNDLADSSVIESLLFDLEDWRKEATITAKETEADKNKMADYGLAKAKLRLKLTGENAPPEILFGNNAALENRIYVRFENSRNVFLAADNIKNAISKKPEEFRDHKLTDIVATQVTRMTVKTPAGEMELQKQADHWQILKPLRARGDDQKVNDLLAQITTSRIQQFVADDRGDLHLYGLTEPRGSVTLFTVDDKQGQVLQIGGISEKQKDQVYVRFTPRSFVYTLPKKIEDVLNTKPNDLRDRHLVRFDENQLDRITIDAPGKSKTVLARKGETWTIVNHGNTTADSAQVRRVVDQIGNEQVTNFVAEVASDLPKYGLDKPQLTLTLSSFASENTAETTAGEHALATIAFGKIEGDNVYARIGDEPFIVAVPRSFLENTPADPLQWQELAIFKFKPDQIHRLSVASDHELVLVRGTNKQWQWVTGTGAINTGNADGISSALAALHAVRWVGNNVPPLAFTKPQLVVTFTTSADDKAMHKLVIGGPAGDGNWLARTDEREGAFVINNADMNALRLPLVQSAATTSSPTVSPTGSTPPASPAVTPNP